MTDIDDKVKKLEEAIVNPPKIHQHTTERHSKDIVDDSAPVIHAADPDVARFILKSVNSESTTIETGCGLSTIAFALSGSKHTVVTPNEEEFTLLKTYFADQAISFDQITWIPEFSEDYLPTLSNVELDFAFIDGKHAFPWPILDWFFAARRLKKGGVMLVDDTYLFPADVLIDFMEEDVAWQSKQTFAKRSAAYTKTVDSILEFEWSQQPYIARRYYRRFTWWRQAAHRIKRMVMPR